MKLTTAIGAILSTVAIMSMFVIYFANNAAASVEIKPQIIYKSQIIEVAILPEPTIYDEIDQEQFVCLTHNIYFEARGESALGQRAVAWVTINRMLSNQFPDTICDVVWQDKQFSWTHDGKSDTPSDDQALAQAESMAREVLQHYYLRPDPTEGSLFFHAGRVSPSWRTSFNRVVQIDNHIFYNLDQG